MLNQSYNKNQVYYDADKGQYYTMTSPIGGLMFPWLMPQSQKDKYRNYLGQSPLGNNNQSMIGQMLANRQPYQYNAPTAQQMFPGMGNPMMGTMPTQAQSNPMLGGGLFGAGRFLGGNYANQSGLLGTSVSGT